MCSEDDDRLGHGLCDEVGSRNDPDLVFAGLARRVDLLVDRPCRRFVGEPRDDIAPEEQGDCHGCPCAQTHGHRELMLMPAGAMGDESVRVDEPDWIWYV